MFRFRYHVPPFRKRNRSGASLLRDVQFELLLIEHSDRVIGFESAASAFGSRAWATVRDVLSIVVPTRLGSPIRFVCPGI